MSYDVNHSGYIKWPLTTGSTDAPTATAGGNVSFGFGNVPASKGGLALYLAGIRLEFAGNLVQAGGAGSRTAWDNFVRAIVADVEIRNTFFGTPWSLRSILGAYLPLIEFVGLGYAYGSPPRGFFPAANATYAYQRPVHLPMGLGTNAKGHHFTQLAQFYKQAQLVLDFPAASVISGISTGSSLTAMTVKATALLLPEPEIRVGPAVEWVDYQVVASSGLENAIRSFGNATSYTGVTKGAAIAFAMLLTSKNGLGGAFTGTQMTGLAVPWRDQPLTTQIGSYIDELYQHMDRPTIGAVVDQGASQALSAFNGFPWAIGTDASNDGVLNNDNILGIPLVSTGRRGQVTKLQEVGISNADESLTMQGTFSGTHHLLAQQLKGWTADQYDAMAKEVVDSGLARRVIGSNGPFRWSAKLEHKNTDARQIDNSKTKYIPVKLVRA